MLPLYTALTRISAPALNHLLRTRLKSGKEERGRYIEKKGITQHQRPKSPLIWLHAASVGEAQSSLILIRKILHQYPAFKILVTTGTVTSAKLMKQKLPDGAFHQYCPLDHPRWVQRFLNHWQPDCVLWMESELWPNMITAIKNRNIPVFLLNARMSPRSFSKWNLFKRSAQKLLSCFNTIFCQTQTDCDHFKALGAKQCQVSGNLKYSAAPLQYDKALFQTLSLDIQGRPVWLYASTHEGEETLACKTHLTLKEKYPDLLTIIVPRHPDRTPHIMERCAHDALNITLRSDTETIEKNTDIYIANTLGELGLFYALCPVSCIGRTFSDDGGGGHNPIEAAQLHCAIIHGANTQNLQEIFDEMNEAGATIKMQTPNMLVSCLADLFSNNDRVSAIQKSAYDFAQTKNTVIEEVLIGLYPTFEEILKQDAR